MILTFSGVVQAVDSGERRIIAGKIAPYGEIGNTSAGKVMFSPNSITASNPDKIKLLMSHDNTKPVGRMKTINSAEDGLYASFKISASVPGDTAILLAQEQLMDGLSVGVEVTASEPKDNYLLVTAAVLREVSLVDQAAFASAAVQSIAASESETVEPTQPTETKTESEAAVTTAPDLTAPEAPDATEQAAPTVEAARTIIMPSALNSQRVRHDITSMGAYTSRKVQAALGDDESRLYVTAADDFSSAGLGFNPTQYLQSVVSTQGNFGRPAMECVDRQAAPTSGLTINRPKFTTYPTTTVEAEGGAVSNTDAVSEYLTTTMSKYSGMQTLSIELTQYSDPGFMEAVTNELVNNYLKVTDAAVVAALTAGGTQATAVAATSAGIISYISTEAPLAYTDSSYFAKNYLAGSSQWSLLLGATDTTGRPIYSAGNPMNNGGNAATTSAKGSVMGLDLFVDRNVVSTNIDESAFIIAPEAMTVFESPQAYMSVNVVANLQVQIAVYGMLGTMVNIAGGIRRFNLT
jgi:HK97 family phage prohead protease/HK97 family phage major capsid protein